MCMYGRSDKHTVVIDEPVVALAVDVVATDIFQVQVSQVGIYGFLFPQIRVVMYAHPCYRCHLILRLKLLKSACSGVEQCYIIIVNEAKDIVVSRQFHLADAVGGHRQTVGVSSLERHETISVEAVQAVVRSYPYHARAVLQGAGSVPMAQAIRIVIETERIFLSKRITAQRGKKEQ